MTDICEELVGDFEGEVEDMDAPVMPHRRQSRDGSFRNIAGVKRKHSSSVLTTANISQDKDRNKSIDERLGQEMFDKACADMIPKYELTKTEEVHQIVRFSPVEFLDLADRAMQNLIASIRPKLTFCFKGQAGTFRKKKGFAEAYVSSDFDWSELLSHLCHVQFAEKQLTFSTNFVSSKDGHTLTNGSFSFSMHRRDQIRTLLQVVEETPAALQTSPDFYLQVESVSESTSLDTLKLLFPFLPYPSEGRGYKSKEDFKGPINMCYRSKAQMEAVYNCFRDFEIDGYPLKVTKPRPAG